MKDVLVFSLTANVEMTKEICGYLGVEPGKIEVAHFADGETMVEPQESVRGKRVFVVQSTCKPVNEHLMELLVCIDAMKRASAAEINVVVPYYGYARQDRKTRARQPITSKLVADLLTAAGIDRIVTVDLHATQIQGFFNIPTDNLSAISLFGHHIRENIPNYKDAVVISPDHGGTTRARDLSLRISNTSPIAIVDKRRPMANHVEVNNIIGDVEGKTCIMVDDICDTGGSLIAGAGLLKEHGAKEIYVYITHAIFSNNALEKLQNSCIDKIVVTNTIPLPEEELKKYPKVEVLSLGYHLARIIESIADGTPLSNVFDIYDED
ncbi:MAG: ribose-phosphate pyrophosphokinase [Erysipelotrichaceae bacterium]|nr:ribose-phosphate pyrophosphokinase [Erysipelotrichaceae bacterium]